MSFASIGVITLQQLLNSQSSLLQDKRVRLVRHKESRTDYRELVKDRMALLKYQREQGRDIFADCDYIVSFFGLERGRSVFFGVFKVNGCKFIESRSQYIYELEQMNVFDDLADRLIINWGDGTRSWVQWYDRNVKEVVEVLPRGYIGSFPGLLGLVLEFEELKTLINNPEANHDWQHHLSAINGIYMIMDSKTGNQYIGSACGDKGVWQRWGDYAVSGHGRNQNLKKLIDDDPLYCRHFRFSILQALPSNITRQEITAMENLYKRKLGSKAHGLNAN